jgi:adenine-specific DNA-methyltransferase
LFLAIDEGSYSSADVYGMIINDKYKNNISYEFSAGLLNSKLYEFYFKSFAKKLGENMYDYYPNTVMRLMVPVKEDSFIAMSAAEIMGCSDSYEAGTIMKGIDRYVYEMFSISDEEIELVEMGCENL